MVCVGGRCAGTELASAAACLVVWNPPMYGLRKYDVRVGFCFVLPFGLFSFDIDLRRILLALHLNL